MKIILFIVSLAIFLHANSLTKKQEETLNIVERVAKTLPDKNGNTHEKTMKAICMTESCAGLNLIGDYHKNKLKESSFGIMQIKLSTARELAKFKEFSFINKMTDESLMILLLNDPVFSTRLATKYFNINHNRFDSSFKGISLYNGGLNNIAYYKAVLRNMEKI